MAEPATIETSVSRHGPIRYVLTDATAMHLRELAQTMRPADRSEVTQAGMTVRKALYRGVRRSVWARTALIDGHVAAVWGLAVASQGLLGATAAPWLLTSALIEAIPVSFFRVARAEVARMRKTYPVLENYVAADYPQAVKMLKLLGFTLDPAEHGFHRFHMGD